MPNGKRAGKVGLKAIIYFELVTTLALIVGIIIINIIKPGENLHINPLTLDTTGVKDYVNSTSKSFTDFILHLIPDNFLHHLLKAILYRCYYLPFYLALGYLPLKEKSPACP